MEFDNARIFHHKLLFRTFNILHDRLNRDLNLRIDTRSLSLALHEAFKVVFRGNNPNLLTAQQFINSLNNLPTGQFDDYPGHFGMVEDVIFKVHNIVRL